MTDPCENCGTPVSVFDINDRRWTPMSEPGVVVTLADVPADEHHWVSSPPDGLTLYEVRSIGSDFCWEVHTPDRCQSARQHRQETR